MALFVEWAKKVMSTGTDFDYIVPINDRCRALLYIACPEKADKLVSRNDLLMNVDNIVSWYERNGRFPTVCVVDDIMTYGRSIQLFLDDYRLLVFRFMQNKNIADDAHRIEINNKLMNSLSIKVFIANESYNFLRSSYSWTMESKKSLPFECWRKDAQMMSKTLWNYRPVFASACVSANGMPQGMPSRENDIPRIHVRSRIADGTSHDFYALTQFANKGIYPSVRIKHIDDGDVLAASCLFVDSLGQEQVDNLLDNILEILHENVPSVVENLKQNPMLRSALFDILCEMLDMIILRVFVNMYTGYDASIALNAENRFRYHNENIRELLEKVSEHIWTCDDLNRIFGTPGGDGESCACNDAATGNCVTKAVENLVYEQAVKHEWKASGLYSRRGFANEDEAKEGLQGVRDVSVGNIVDAVVDIERTHETDATVNALSVLTLLADKGYVYLTPKYVNDANSQNSDQYIIEVETTETTLSILPERISGKWDEFYKTAEILWASDGFPEYVEKLFANSNIVQDVKYFAETIRRYREISQVLIEWKL